MPVATAVGLLSSLGASHVCYFNVADILGLISKYVAELQLTIKSAFSLLSLSRCPLHHLPSLESRRQHQLRLDARF